MKRLKSAAALFLRLCKWLAITLFALICAYLVTRYLLAPVALFLAPSLDPLVYDYGLHGTFPQRFYRSFDLPSPDARAAVWNPLVCDLENANGGLVSLDNHGPKAGKEGPMLLDLKGNLIWRDTSYGDYAMNVKVQSWRDELYLTFWAGSSEKGNYYMLDSGYNLVHNVSVVGHGLQGDPHEFKITPEGTALVIIYNLTTLDVSDTDLPLSKAGWYDAMIQELDIESGELLFQWRASDHLRPENGEYLRATFDADPHAQSGGLFANWGAPLEYYHFNSVDKDLAGNYLLSIRYTHQVICISYETGEILWGMGGTSTDFTDLSDGNALSFKWQHDARWIDEDNGIFGLFDNGIKHGHMATAWHSRGMIIHLDTANRTAEHLHNYPSSTHIRSLSQGSFQYLAASPNTTTESIDHAFIGWGSAGAYSLHAIESEEVLCETHFMPAIYYPLGLVEAYRVYRAPPEWVTRPTAWDPSAVIFEDALYVSWNGAVEVRSWLLQQAVEIDLDEGVDSWNDLALVEKSSFETRTDIPPSREDALESATYRIAALNAAGEVLRYSNNVQYRHETALTVSWFWFGAATPLAILPCYLFARRKDRWTVLRRWLRSPKRAGVSDTENVVLLPRQ